MILQCIFAFGASSLYVGVIVDDMVSMYEHSVKYSPLSQRMDYYAKVMVPVFVF